MAALLLVVLPPPAPAQGASAAYPGALDFALHLGRSTTAVPYPQEEVDNTVKRIGVEAYEEVAPNLQLALLGGYAHLSQPNQALTSGMNLQGYFAGVGLRVTFLRARPLTAAFSANYIYQHVEGDKSAQSVAIEWHELELRLGGAVQLTPSLALMAGPTYGRIDGEQRAKGAINQTTDLAPKARAGGFAGLELDVGGDGHVGFQIQRGLQDGFDIYFQRFF